MKIIHFNSFVTSITSSQGRFQNQKGHSNANLKGGSEVGLLIVFKLSFCCRSCFVGLTQIDALSDPYDAISPIYNTNVCGGWQLMKFKSPCRSLQPSVIRVQTSISLCDTASLHNRNASAHISQLTIQRHPQKQEQVNNVDSAIIFLINH